MQDLKLKWLFFWWAIACFWFASWLTPATRELWDSLDQAIFFSLNGSLAGESIWHDIWAFTNWRPFDIIGGGFILAITFSWIYSLPRQQRLDVLSGMAVLLVIILITRFSAAGLLYLTDYQRYSPSITLTPSYRLSELVTWIDPKDYHKDCFPGDHGYVVITCIAFFFYKAGRRWGSISLILLPFILPRLFSGAHWATDILIGSMTMTLVSLPLLLCTPLYRWLTGLIGRALQLLFRPLLAAIKLI
jgi:hypothetical protein